VAAVSRHHVCPSEIQDAQACLVAVRRRVPLCAGHPHLDRCCFPQYVPVQTMAGRLHERLQQRPEPDRLRPHKWQDLFSTNDLEFVVCLPALQQSLSIFMMYYLR
jgi:hypothetical protein